MSVTLGLAICSTARAAERGKEVQRGGAAASNPAAIIRFQDFRYRYFDLDNGGESRNFEAEGAFTPLARFKITHGLSAVRTDRGGETRGDFQEARLRGTFVEDAPFLAPKTKYLLGLQFNKDLGDFKDGTGSDRILAIGGLAWLPTELDFGVVMIQHLRSIRKQDDAPKVRSTGPKLVYIRGLRALNGWLTVDWTGQFDHDDGNNFSSTLKLELGSMLTPNIGLYAEAFVDDQLLDSEDFQSGLGLALRIIY